MTKLSVGSAYSGSHNERFVTPACSNQPTTSPNDTAPNAAAIAESNAPLVLAPTAFTNPSILLNANSMGSKSGPYPGNNTDSHPRASIASRTSGLRCTPADPAPRSAPAWVWEREGARGTLKRHTSHRSGRRHRVTHTLIEADGCNQAGVLPTALRYPPHGTLSPGGVGVGRGRGEVEAALIHEHRPVRVDTPDPSQVPPPGLWTLFTGVDRLFFSSIPISVPSGTWWLC